MQCERGWEDLRNVNSSAGAESRAIRQEPSTLSSDGHPARGLEQVLGLGNDRWLGARHATPLQLLYAASWQRRRLGRRAG